VLYLASELIHDLSMLLYEEIKELSDYISGYEKIQKTDSVLHNKSED
jgi:hypothetical protein